MPSIENPDEAAAPQVPKTELEELQIKANSVADEVSSLTLITFVNGMGFRELMGEVSRTN